MWKKITTNEDIKELMETFDEFHDSCLKKLSYVSGAYVDKKLAMFPLNCLRSLKVIFQRQQLNPITIEIEFIGVEQLLLRPVKPDYTCNIFAATMFLKDGLLYWYDDKNIRVNNYEMFDGTMICSTKARWRFLD